MSNCPIIKPIEVKNISQDVSKVIIKTDDEKNPYSNDKTIRLYLGGAIENEKQAEQKVEKIIENVLNTIAYNVKWSSVGRAYYKCSKGLGEREQRTYEGIYINSDIEGIMKLEEKINNFSDYDNDYYRLFRFAMACDDIISKYMLLYQILLYLKGPSQIKLDRYINSVCARQEINIDPEYKRWQTNRGEDETIFTFLRNQVGHVVQGFTKAQMVSNMRNKIDDLIELVKIAINENIN